MYSQFIHSFMRHGRVAAASAVGAAAVSASCFMNAPFAANQSVFAEANVMNKDQNDEEDMFIVKKALDPSKFQTFKVRDVKQVTHDSKRVRFDLPSQHHELGLKTASCLVAKADIDGKTVIRPYTPTTRDHQKGFFDLVVKGYPNGKMSKHIVNLQPGDELAVKGPFQKMPIEPNMKKAIGLIAGGSGITPMLQVIQHLLDDPRDQTEIRLLYANRSENDIMLKNRLDALALIYPRFKVHYVVDKAEDSSKWDGFQGHINKDIVAKTMPPPDSEHLVMVCGPPPMMKAISGDKKSKSEQGDVDGVLKDMKYSNDMVFKF